VFFQGDKKKGFGGGEKNQKNQICTFSDIWHINFIWQDKAGKNHTLNVRKNMMYIIIFEEKKVFDVVFKGNGNEIFNVI